MTASADCLKAAGQSTRNNALYILSQTALRYLQLKKRSTDELQVHLHRHDTQFEWGLQFKIEVHQQRTQQVVLRTRGLHAKAPDIHESSFGCPWSVSQLAHASSFEDTWKHSDELLSVSITKTAAWPLADSLGFFESKAS